MLQFRDRISSYIANGHPIDKIEILVLGGTWSEYPEGYQVRSLQLTDFKVFGAGVVFPSRSVRSSLIKEFSACFCESRAVDVPLCRFSAPYITLVDLDYF